MGRFLDDDFYCRPLGALAGSRQRRMRFNPRANDGGGHDLFIWQSGGPREARDRLPPAPPEAIERAKLKAMRRFGMQVRNDGMSDEAWLLYRGDADCDRMVFGREGRELDGTFDVPPPGTVLDIKERLGWTPNEGVAQMFARQYEPPLSDCPDGPFVQTPAQYGWVTHSDGRRTIEVIEPAGPYKRANPGRYCAVCGALWAVWVPRRAIHTIPLMWRSPGDRLRHDEWEIIVNPFRGMLEEAYRVR